MNSKVLRKLLIEARKTKTAIPAFNYSDMWDLIAIINASRKCKVDVIVDSNPRLVKAMGTELCQAMVSALKEKSNISIFNHLDHSTSIDLCIKAIEAGYPSVMFDGSKLPLEENIKMTKEVVDYAHKRGVLVEGEKGRKVET